VLLTFLFGAHLAEARPPSRSLEAPKRQYDAGTVYRGARVAHTFLLRNTGKAELRILAEPSCGCTTTEFDEVIPPGGVGKVAASFDTSSERGLVTKRIEVTTKDRRSTPIVLTLKAHVAIAIDVQPSDAPYLKREMGQLEPHVLTVASTDRAPFDLLKVEHDDLFDVEVTSAPRRGGAAAGRSNRYLVTLTPRDPVPVGRSDRTLTLVTSHRHAERIPIRVSLDVSGPPRVAPAQPPTHSTAP
jgi:hypothetical protein